MNTRYAIALNGAGLQDLDARILVTDIQESAPRVQRTTVANARYDGLRLIRESRQSLSVTVTFLLREYDTARRKALCADVCVWAASGGWLTISDRPGQRLRVHADVLPAVTSALRWTDPLTLTLIALEQPYWQDEYPTSLHQDIPAETLTTLSLLPPGNAPHCPLTCTLVNHGTTAATALTLNAGDTLFRLSDPALIPAGGTLIIDYDEQGLLRIRSGSTSMLHARSADSSDDLLLIPSQVNSVSILCDQPLTASLHARGMYL